MSYMLRIVQHFRPADEKVFMQLEKKFAALERRKANLPKGTRMQPYTAKERRNTLVWQCQVETLQAAHDAIAALNADKDHEALYQKQVPYMLDAYIEIYEMLDF